MEWIHNQWVIGISTSVISGFLVFFFTKRFFTDKQKREYEQKVKTANNEILYAIRPLIVEKTKPDNQILDSIFISTARKYGVDLSDIYSTSSLCDDLTNEIMSNSFLSSEQKIELANLISSIKSDKSSNKEKEPEKVIIVQKSDKTSLNSTYMAVTLSIVSAMIALVISLLSGIKGSSIFNDILIKNSDFKSPEFLIIVFFATLTPLIALLMTTFLKFLKEKEKMINKVEKVKVAESVEKKDEPSHNKSVQRTR